MRLRRSVGWHAKGASVTDTEQDADRHAVNGAGELSRRSNTPSNLTLEPSARRDQARRGSAQALGAQFISIAEVGLSRRPVVQDRLFDEVDTPQADQVARRFQPWVVDELHSFLNTLPCLADVQAIRKRWKTRTGSPDAFGTFKADPRHWYSFNHGGRNEGQLNVGMSPQYFRVGLGFEFTEKQGGNPSEVTLAYTVFRNLTTVAAEYAKFVKANYLEVEFFPTATGIVGNDSTASVVGWEPPPWPPIQWIFFGRLLRRRIDRRILEDDALFGSVLRDVLCGFKPFWARAQEQAATLK